MLNSNGDYDGFFKPFYNKVRAALSDEQITPFAELKNDEDRFSYVYGLPQVHDIEVKEFYREKNKKNAKALKDEGNKAFQSGDYRKALHLYSKSIIQTPTDEGTHDLSVVTANRSATLYHMKEYDLALTDIKEALSLAYPEELHHKLFDRRARCLMGVKQYKDAMNNFQKAISALDSAKLTPEKKRHWQTDIQKILQMMHKAKDITNVPRQSKSEMVEPLVTGGQNSQYPSTCSMINIAETEEQGRFAAAKSKIRAGDTLLIEGPYAAVLLPEKYGTHCFTCCKSLRVPVPCPKCGGIAFCSTACREIALDSHHKFECTLLELLRASGISITCYLVLRIFTQAGLQHFLSIRPQLEEKSLVPYHPNDYRTVYNLVRHEERRKPEDFFHRSVMAVFLFRCLKITGFFKGFSESSSDTLTQDEIFIGGLLLRHLQSLQFNAHEVSELQFQKNGSMDNVTSVFLGAAVYPTLALFNHSCDPGIVRYFLGTTVVVRAVKNIKPGEMVAENYGPIFTQTDRAERQSTLSSQYWFDCSCKACEENWPKFSNMTNDFLRFRCTGKNCINVIPVNADGTEFMATCSVCNHATNILKGLKSLQDTDAMFKRGMKEMESGNVSKAMKMFLEVLEILDETLAPPFRDYHLCQQGIRRCMITMGNRSFKSDSDTV